MKKNKYNNCKSNRNNNTEINKLRYKKSILQKRRMNELYMIEMKKKNILNIENKLKKKKN